MIKPGLTTLSVVFLFISFSIFLLTSCESKKEIVPEAFKPRSNHAAYLYSLEQANLLHTALGSEWQLAADEAIAKPLQIETPFVEEFYINPSEATAIGYRFSANRGHKIEIDVQLESTNTIQIFLDVFRVDNDSLGAYTHVASASEEEWLLGFEPRIDAEYVVRLQSELLRGGIFRVQIQKVPALSFPVAGKDKKAIGSLFGAPRDGGKRKHHGVDIFARRHTPILAPTEGRVRSVKENELGGKVIWLRDTKRDQTLYFAHLENVAVDKGMYVSVGDTLGTVGNSGNARTTAPHLHFGIYKSGPVDPYHFIANTRKKYKRELADKSLLGKTIRTRKKSNLKVLGMTKNSLTIELPKFQIMEAKGASAAYFRVRLPDETEGYIVYSDVEVADEPIKRQLADSDNPLLSNPTITAVQVDRIEDGEQLKVLGGNEDYYFVEQVSGRKGWIQAF